MQPNTKTLTPTREEALTLDAIRAGRGIAADNAGWVLEGLRAARFWAPQIIEGKLGADPARLGDALRETRRSGERGLRREGATRAQVAAWAAGADEGHEVAKAALFTALEMARSSAAEGGTAMALDLVHRIEAEPALLPILPDAVATAVAAALAMGVAQGLAGPYLDAFRAGYLKGADLIIAPFLEGLASGKSRPKAILPFAVPLEARRAPAARPLRPEDFGSLPARPSPA